jgi:hypothetical protein
MTAQHALAQAAMRWTEDTETLARAEQAGATCDALVAAALASTDSVVIRAAVRQLDLGAPQWFRVNMPGPSATRWYEAARRALHAHAIAVLGPVEGERTAPRLEYEPLPTPTAGSDPFAWMRAR